MTDKLRLTDEQIEEARLLTSDEMQNCLKEARKFAKSDPDSGAYKVKLSELTGILSARKIESAVLANLTAVEEAELVAKFLYDNFNTISKGTWEELPQFNESKQWWLAQAKILISLIQPTLLAKAETYEQGWADAKKDVIGKPRKRPDLILTDE